VILRIGLLAGLLLALHTGPAVAADGIWALMKKPGAIVLLRHSNAPGSALESNDMNFRDCSIQRNLDDAGRAQAARIGDAFRKNGIKNVRLMSSQYCRAMDTAKLMKFGPVTQQRVLNQVFLANVFEMQDAGVKGRALMRTLPKNRVTVLVSHVTNIQAMAGVLLDSGEMALVRLSPTGDVAVEGRFKVP
jgi:phosphohistidine phosphatase SixA